MRLEAYEHIDNAQQLKQYCTSQLNAMSEIRQGLNTLVKELSENFTGETGTAIVSYLTEVIRPLLEKVDNTFKEFDEVLEKIEQDTSSNFGYGGIIEDDYVQTDYLRDARQFTEELIENIAMTNNVIRSIDWILPLSQLSTTDIENDFNALEKEAINAVELREEYDSKWSSDLDVIEQSVEEIKRMLSILDNNNVSPTSYQSGDILKFGDGVLFLNLDMTMNDSEFREFMKREFGFDDDTIDIMIKLRQALKDKYPHLTDDELSYLYLRIVGGFTYDEDGMGEWSIVAGNLSLYFPNGVMSTEELLLSLGLSQQEYERLRYMVRIQNLMTSSPDEHKLPENWYELLGDDDSWLSSWKKYLEIALGRPLLPDEFYNEWIKMLEGFMDKGDYAHQSITTSTLLNNMPSFVENMSGWQGDTTNNIFASPSIGPEDYRSDLDAANIKYFMRKYGLTYEQAQKKYYSELSSGIVNRAEIFKEHTSYEDALRIIVNNLFPDPNPNSDIPILTLEQKLSLMKEKYPDSYNFLMSLKNNDNTLGSY